MTTRMRIYDTSLCNTTASSSNRELLASRRNVVVRCHVQTDDRNECHISTKKKLTTKRNRHLIFIPMTVVVVAAAAAVTTILTTTSIVSYTYHQYHHPQLPQLFVTSFPLSSSSLSPVRVVPLQRKQQHCHRHNIGGRHSTATGNTFLLHDHRDDTAGNSGSNNLNRKMTREIEIRQQIRALKQQGRITNKKKPNNNLNDTDETPTNDDEQYRKKLRQKLGTAKSKYLVGADDDDDGDDNDNTVIDVDDDDDDDDEDDDDDKMIYPDAVIEQQRETTPIPPPQQQRRGQIGAIPQQQQQPQLSESDVANTAVGRGYQRQQSSIGSMKQQQFAEDEEEEESSDLDFSMDNNNDDDPEGDDEEELSEDDLVDLVAQLLQQQSSFPISTGDNEDDNVVMDPPVAKPTSTTTTTTTKTTSGIGGTWDSTNNTEATQDVYQPKTGSWGAFPRPRDISKAYGGGRRVGVGYTPTTTDVTTSTDDTRLRLQRYRTTVGIDVESEKINAQEIDDAMKVAAYAMQRGVYTSAVTALEKVTKHCSTNSKVGGKVFLELAMAYEAAGQTPEAITVYTTLSRSRNEEVASMAKRLLYGIEAIKFMQENVGSSEFSRKQAKTTFIDTTGLNNFARNFDDVYETAYIDMNNNYYKQLTEAVVRTSREARQILIRATTPRGDGSESISRLRIVQALRSLSRYFEEALQDEIDSMKPLPEPVAVMDGKPIVQQDRRRQKLSTSGGGCSSDGDYESMSSQRQLDEYILMDPLQMIENLHGEWQLHLIANKRGDGVKFFNNNTSLVWQTLDTISSNSNDMQFTSYCAQGILTVEPTGQLEFNNKRRILRRSAIEMTGTGSMITNLLGGATRSKMGSVGAICTERQMILVDSTLLVTRGVPSVMTSTKFGTTITTRSTRKEDERDYFAVWRRVVPGTYSKPPKKQS